MTKAANLMLCFLGVFVCVFAFFTFAHKNDVALGATSSLSVSVDDASDMPFDLDYSLNICDESGKVVNNFVFNGVPDTTQSASLTVGQKYSISVFVPTSVFCTLIVGDVEINSNYAGYDFVMPSGGIDVILSLYTQNPSIFTDTTII